jgi:hypothetical protein
LKVVFYFERSFRLSKFGAPLLGQKKLDRTIPEDDDDKCNTPTMSHSSLNDIENSSLNNITTNSP